MRFVAIVIWMCVVMAVSSVSYADKIMPVNELYKVDKAIKYSNVLLVGPTLEKEQGPQIKMVDVAIVRGNMVYAYGSDNSEKIYELGPWSIYTAALPIHIDAKGCKYAKAYILPKGHKLKYYKLTLNEALCIDYDDKRREWIASRSYYDTDTGEEITISEYLNPDAIDIYTIDPNGMLNIKNGKIEFTLQ